MSSKACTFPYSPPWSDLPLPWVSQSLVYFRSHHYFRNFWKVALTTT